MPCGCGRMSYRCISVGGGLVQVQLFLLRHGHASSCSACCWGALCVGSCVRLMAAGAAPQDSLAKSSSTKRLKPLTYIKYGVLLLAVVLLPRAGGQRCGDGRPVLCKYICPQGVLEGSIPLAAVNAGIRSALGQPLYLETFRSHCRGGAERFVLSPLLQNGFARSAHSMRS